ncbi:AcrR family transcriptional regulator [Microbacterium terrae]|uniref:TetR/AcrR family transcriptional regulator n=1 Tax=Microbacterium terrae TaxID=69369 RepID=UPI001B3A9D6A|nr:TetR/AcrR family transcriptional regulator [Microbacterium terrae]MBP1076331.1 AcrR family transcriptional regulator [Microbacterium terrae]
MNSSAQSDPAAEAAVGWREYSPIDLPIILAVSLEQFIAKGYHATSVREIARAVGVTVPAIYYHFENKQALLVSLLEKALEALTSKIEGALAEADDDPVSQLSALVQGIAMYMAHYSEIAFLDNERRALTPENLAWYIHARDDIETPLQRAVDAGVESGLFQTTEPHECCRAILAMCQGIAGWYRMGGPISPSELAERYSHIALAVVEHRTAD